MRIVLSIIFSLAMGLGLFLLSSKETAQVEITRFLPADTIIYAEEVEGVDSLRRFLASPLGKVLDSLDYQKIITQTGLNELYQKKAETVLDALDKLKNDQLVHHLLGEKCSIALVPHRQWSAKVNSVEKFVRQHTVFISKPDLDNLSIGKLLSLYRWPFEQRVLSYGSHTINRMVFNEREFFVSIIEGYVVASFEERMLRESIDIFDNNAENLATNSEFSAHRSALMDVERFLFLSVEGLQKLARYGASRSGDERTKAVLRELSALKGITNIAYGSWRDKEISNDKLLAKLNREAMEPEVGQMISTRPSINDTLSLAGSNALLYYWSNTMNPNLFWKMFVKEAGEKDEDIESIRLTVKNSTGHEVEQILSMVDSSFSILLQPSLRAQFIPIPDMALMVKLHDEESINQLIQKSLQGLDIQLQSRSYKNVPYYVWGIYDRESLQPVYTIYRGYLIVANTMDILKAILDTPLTQSQLVAAEMFEGLDPGFQKLNNSVFYVDQATLAMHLDKIISWLGTIVAIQDRQAGIYSRVITEDLLSPLLQGLAMYEKSATRTSLEGDTIIIESKTKIRE